MAWRVKLKKVLLILAIALITWHWGKVWAFSGKFFYVAPHGNDAGDGTEAQPWQTLQHAADMAKAGIAYMSAPAPLKKKFS